MWANLTTRMQKSRNLPDVIAGGRPDVGSKQERLTWLKVLIGYTTRLPSDLDNVKKWPLLPEGIFREDAGKELADEDFRKKIAGEAAAEWLSKEMIDRSLAQLEAQIRSNPGKFDKVSVIYPEPAKLEYTKNHIPAAFAAKLEEAITDRQFPVPIKFVSREEGANPLDESVYIIAKGSRGVPKANAAESEEQKRYTYAVQRICRQVCVAGNVKEGTLYWLIDDGVTIGSTLCNYYSHITTAGGKVGTITTLSKRSSGTEILAPQLESVEFLYEALRYAAHKKASRNIQPDSYYEEEGWDIYRQDFTAYEQDLDAYTKQYCNDIYTHLKAIGLEINLFSQPYQDVKPNFQRTVNSTTMTNQEILLLGAYFMDPANDKLWDLLNKALVKIGTTVEVGGDSYAVKVAELTPGNIIELRRMMHDAQKDRREFMDELEIRKHHITPSHVVSFPYQDWIERLNGFDSVEADIRRG